MTRWLALLVCLAGCRDYEHFTHTDDASASSDGSVENTDMPDAVDGGTSDGAMVICPPTTDMLVPIGREYDAQTTPGQLPSSVVVTKLGPGSTMDAFGLVPGPAGTASIVRWADFAHKLSTSALPVGTMLEGGATSFAVATSSLGYAQFVVAYDGGAGSSTLVQYDFEGNATMPTTTAIVLPTTDARPIAIALGKVDSDDEPDLVVAFAVGSTTQLHVFYGSTNGFNASGANLQMPFSGSSPLMLAIVPGPDPVIAVLQPYASATAVLQLYQVAGSSISTVTSDFNVNQYTLSIAAGDVDGDGQGDLVLGGQDTSGTLTIVSNPSVKNPKTFSALVGGPAVGLQTLDFNHDGALDLFAWVQATGSAGTALLPTVAQQLPRSGPSAPSFQSLPFAGHDRSTTLIPTIPSPAVGADACNQLIVFCDTATPQISVFSP